MSEKDGFVICDGCAILGADCEISEMGQDFCDWRCSEKATLARMNRAFLSGKEAITTGSGTVAGCIPAAFVSRVDEHTEIDSLRARIAELEGLLIAQTVDDIANIIDADGAQKARSESLAVERDTERARADRYLAVLKEVK